jgi:RecB family endonuclease NucS
LIKFYKRAKKDFAEINLFFNLNENNAKIVLTPLLSRFAKKDQLRITFEEICYTNKITDDDVKSYLSLLEDRIEDIEDVINMHIDLVKESII